ncbi:MAG: 1-(5-phosphoribosyl)-5-amino-4-imidazole-carboxylate carboxylase [Candidatus Handelsmanbacteria bacterium RIFCSPLOWO2_12_FULL_64_10]|uniref:1-(5-phosphoribosyl)-5-amino-4-imidazole-carboxylate carboxylase n=1 Tax=Handelsmanbacteria sp. (strain RIFCSPLOWO2_12_FULL_64_10) TaxID=1817868 RepID=A0A1F6CYR3_HANXR|nr:MAG: 1-(5-phosphoribosyl)-5-amino-4-imidazole-carboxylate carboxylase [Candidatus Handelsmanbacteria bacterium RIFCSPLOWO2_12_FULL_64_10]
MSPERIRELLEGVRAGQMSIDAALESLKDLPFEDLGFATVDHHRALRQGFPEVVFCQGKTTDQVVEIARRIAGAGVTMLATRADAEKQAALRATFPEAEVNALGRTVLVRSGGGPAHQTMGTVLVVSAGTSDLPVAEEAVVTALAMGNRVERLYDVGVAGIHRLLAHRELLTSASVIVVVAGMEGALASVVGGLVDVPVIAVPTSVGYGASFGGLAALLAMLNSCAAGVTVVNIDNGFGAGMAASLINRVRSRP